MVDRRGGNFGSSSVHTHTKDFNCLRTNTDHRSGSMRISFRVGLVSATAPRVAVLVVTARMFFLISVSGLWVEVIGQCLMQCRVFRVIEFRLEGLGLEGLV